MKIFGKHIISVLTLAFALVSCVDEDLYTDDHIPGGETEFAATVSFSAFAPALETRAAGDAIKEINTLWLVIYEKGEDDTWTLEKDGKIQITAAHRLTTSFADNSRPDGNAQAENRTCHASFRLRHKNGQYKIYAVANLDLSTVADSDIYTPGQLKGLNLTWNEEDVRKNAEMFGCFTNDKSESIPEDETVTISPNCTLHAWIRRAASKVTVAFDGRSLAEDVTIYLMSASIKDIPRSCSLGAENQIVERDSLIRDGEMIKYFEGDVPPGATDFITGYKATITNETPVDNSVHEETARALFFYENMQGRGKDKAQTAAGPGNANGNDYGIGYPDPKENDEDSGWKDNKPCGTYIEVQAIYRSTNPERPGNGIIKYRFMLGKDIHTDYNAERNYHYKLTMRFNKFANDVDWHIDYSQQVLEVTQPKVFDYQGKVFVPDNSRPNRGHKFSDRNTVTVTSYIEDDKGTMVPVDITYKDQGKTNFSDSSDWLDCEISPGDHPYEQKVKFFIKEEEPELIDINYNLKHANSEGSQEVPYNLADPNGTPDNIVCTSNCYIINAPGWYIFPLVYGNAIHNGGDNKSSYTYTGGDIDDSTFNILGKFKNHLNKPIESPYIVDNEGCNPTNAYLVWQDVNNLLRPHFDWDWDTNGAMQKSPTYLKDAYGGKGGIRFYVDPENIKQGNAMIAVSDKAPVIDKDNHTFVLPDAIWSWHIWVTRFDFEECDKTITVTAKDTTRKFEFMPVNLGWCSDDGDTIKYYKGRECEIKFSAGDTKSTTIKIVKKSHIAFTRGNNPYYQWGRKDPFVAATGERVNKSWWNLIGYHDGQNPPRLSKDDAENKDRYTTRNALHLLIRKPNTWHNPPRKPGTNGNTWASDNETYANLWEGRPGSDPEAATIKTVYDPCPVGYQVPHYNAVSGFTTTGDDPGVSTGKDDFVSQKWYDVWVDDIKEGNPTDGLFEFYTNPDKYQSIIFPQTGYRDWDNFAYAHKISFIGYIWMAGNYKNNDNYFYNFEFSRGDDKGNSYIRPKNTYYPCDGFPVRPVRNGSHGLGKP